MFLTLSINNQTVSSSGQNTDGFKADDIFLLIQGKQQEVGSTSEALLYHYLDWEDGQFKMMEPTDNDTDLNLLGIGLESVNDELMPVKYASYGMRLSEILAKDWVLNSERIPIPLPIEGGRVYISLKRPVFLRTITKGTPAEPADDSPFDPNTGTIWDKFEFTVKAKDRVLFCNTSCVDFMGIPMTFEVEKNGVKHGPQGFVMGEDGVDTSDPVSSIVNAMKQTAANIAGLDEAGIDKLITPFRIFAPKVKEHHFGPTFGENGDFLNPYIDFCWQAFSNQNIRLGQHYV